MTLVLMLGAYSIIHRVVITMLLALMPVWATADIDTALIKRFESMGADFSKPRRISFVFRVAAEQQTALEAELRSMGYEVESNTSQHPTKMVTATTTMLVTSKRLREHRKDLEPLANKYEGVFDGWGTGFQPKTSALLSGTLH